MKNILLPLLILISPLCFAQIKNLEVLVGKNDTYISKYFDSLNSLKPNPYFKIYRDVDNDGNLVLTAQFAIADQPFLTCTSIMAIFNRTKTGMQICGIEVISGSVEYAQSNLDYVKDNFTKIEPAKWEKPFGHDIPYKIGVEFERKEGEYPQYVLTYFIKSP